MEIIISMPPIAKARPRFFVKGNYVGAYNPQTTEEGKWLLLAKGQITETFFNNEALYLRVEFIMPVPKSSPKKFKKRVETGEIIWHTKKPDLDNLIKFIKDNLSKVLWRDDSQVVEIEACKHYGNMPATKIIVGNVEKMECKSISKIE